MATELWDSVVRIVFKAHVLALGFSVTQNGVINSTCSIVYLKNLSLPEKSRVW